LTRDPKYGIIDKIRQFLAIKHYKTMSRNFEKCIQAFTDSCDGQDIAGINTASAKMRVFERREQFQELFLSTADLCKQAAWDAIAKICNVEAPQVPTTTEPTTTTIPTTTTTTEPSTTSTITSTIATTFTDAVTTFINTTLAPETTTEEDSPPPAEQNAEGSTSDYRYLAILGVVAIGAVGYCIYAGCAKRKEAAVSPEGVVVPVMPLDDLAELEAMEEGRARAPSPSPSPSAKETGRLKGMGMGIGESEL